jgi:hypothetical protein
VSDISGDIRVVLDEILRQCPDLRPVARPVADQGYYDRVYGPYLTWSFGVINGVVYVWVYKGDGWWKDAYSCPLCDPDCLDKVVGFLSNGAFWLPFPYNL